MSELNVMDFKAVGDGNADDSGAFNAALLAMQVAGSSRGNKLIIPAGTFRLEHELNVECNCIIEGAGVGDERSSSTILYFCPSGSATDRGSHGIVINTPRGSTTGRNPSWSIIRDLTIYARNMTMINRHGIIVRSRVKIENVNVLGFSGNGIHLVTGDGNNSDGNTLWKPGQRYTVGDWVMEPGFSKTLLTSVSGTLALQFNPQGSGDTINNYTIRVTRSINWSNTPSNNDTLIIPAGSVLAGVGNANVGSYIIMTDLGPITATSFWAAKVADDPFVPANGIRRNPVSVPIVAMAAITDAQVFSRPQKRYGCSVSGISSTTGEGPGDVYIHYHNPAGTLTGTVTGRTSGATATVLNRSQNKIIINGSTRAFINGEPLTFSGGGTATSGEFRLNYKTARGSLTGTITGRTSGATATIVEDYGEVFAISTVSGTFTTEEIIFSNGGGAIATEKSGQYLTGGTQQHTIGINIPDGPGSDCRWTQTTPAIPNDMGNANNWQIEYCRVSGVGVHGLFIEGDNVNAGTSINFDCSGSGGWAIYDNSFLGNTHIGPHAESNDLGAYRTAAGGNAHNVFIGCYSEGGAPPSKIYSPGISIGGIMASGFAADSSGFRLDGSGMSSHTVVSKYYDKEIRTTIGVASEAGGVFGGLQFTHTDDWIGFMMGNYNHLTGSWNFGKVNYPPSFEVLGGLYSNVFRPSGGLVIPAGPGIDKGGVFPGVFILATNGYPLLGSGGRNSFYPGTLILNQNVSIDRIKGWICIARCGSGPAWQPSGPTSDPIYPGATVTPSIPNGFVYRSMLSGPSQSGTIEPVWPLVPGQTVVDGRMTWECFGSTTTGLAEIQPDQPATSDSTAVPGNATQNNTRGRVAVAPATDRVTVMNSKITATSCVYATIQTNDITCKQILSVVPAQGSFTIIFNNTATAAVNVCWKLEV